MIPKSKTAILYFALELGYKRGEGSAYSNIGNAHRRLGNYQDALKYHHKHKSETVKHTSENKHLIS